MSFSQTHAGISVTGEKLQIVELTYNNDGILVENIDEEFFEDYLDFFVKGTKFNSQLQKAFDNLIIRKPLKNNVVSFSLPYDIFKHVELPFDSSLIKADLLEQFKWEFSVLYPNTISDEYLLQYVEIDDDETSRKETALVIAAMKKQIKTIHKFCVRNNLNLKYIDYAHFAVNNLIGTTNLMNAESKTVSLYIGNGYLSFVLLKQNSPILFFVKKIANAADIIPQLNKIIEKINQVDLSLSSIDNFYITGDNISDELVEQLNSSFDVNFNKLNPFAEFAVNPSLVNNKFLTKGYNSFAAAAGISLRLL